MRLDDEFLQILSVLVSQQSSGEPFLPESWVEDAVRPDAARPSKRSEEKKGRELRP
jgi:hypothetical protein